MGPVAVEQAAKLLDFSQQQIDVQLLDSVVDAMYAGIGQQQREAQEILTQLKEHPDAWTRVDAILEYSQNPQTKFYALQILDNVITTRWRKLPREQCEGIKKYVVGLVIKLSSDSVASVREKLYLNKLNMVLVQIVKREWPKEWPTFIQDIVGASHSNESLCRNNMVILKLLSEEVFDFSTGQMTQSKATHLKQQFCTEFRSVFELCQFILTNSSNGSLVEATLETLLRFLNWIPVGYIFETQLIATLSTKFLSAPLFRNVTLQCLTEIAAVSLPTAATKLYDRQLLLLFLNVTEQLKGMLNFEVSIREAFNSGSDNEQKFISNLALFLGTYLKERASLVEVRPDESLEAKEISSAHNCALMCMLKISEVEDVEIFKICLEYWNWLVSELYREMPIMLTYSMSSTLTPFGFVQQETPFRRQIYSPHLSHLRYIIIGRMAKPEEVLVIENDEGEVVREMIKDTDSINLYKNMRETLVYLTHLDYGDTERIMTEKLQNQVNGIEWSWKNLNTLCWAIGSISGALMEEDEKRFLVMVIRDLLGLCEQKRGKDNKAVIASNIMYVVGQYPRFLRAHWKFLKTVINKLFEFMHETHEGVQDMACDTFIKIAHKCRRHFVITQVGETEPFIDEILSNLGTTLCDLSTSQVHVFYEAVGYMISAQQDQSIQQNLIERLMSLPNTVWDDIIVHASADVEVLTQPEVVKNLINILKSNTAACKSVGNAFICQLGRIYLDLLNVYKATSEKISAAVTLNGEGILKQPAVRSMRAVKTEILRLITTWISQADQTHEVYLNFVTPLFEAVLFDYQRNVAAASEPEVLSTVTAIVEKLGSIIIPEVPKILDAVFTTTLNMINKDFAEYPEHRTNFFILLQAINTHCFPALLNIPPEQFKLIVDSIIWAFKHSMRNVTEVGLEILLKLLENVATRTPAEAAQKFYQLYFLELLQHLLCVVTDSTLTQVAGLTSFAVVLCRLFTLIDNGAVMVPLGGAAQTKGNTEFLFDYVYELLHKAFPHLTGDQLRVIVKGFFTYDDDIPKLKEHLRDFLVQLKEYAGEDVSDLYLEEKEQEMQVIIQEKLRVASLVPGMLNPHEIQEDMQDQTNPPAPSAGLTVT
uniref:Importin N-terminal domain-containing protein n=1 Tax=Trichuris muris TaxID=70415 RepID=A0A5S6QV72_TRIMR